MYSALLKHILLPLGSLFFSGNYAKHLKSWKAYDQLSSEALEELQQKRLQEILAYAQEHVPYYRNLSNTEIYRLEDLPVLNKKILREQGEHLVSDEFQIDQLDVHHSSGSSGFQSFTRMDKAHTFYLRALQTHWWSWGGYEPGKTLLQAGMTLQRGFTKKVKDILFRVHYMSAFNLTAPAISKAILKVHNRNPKYIAGYPSALNEIAKHALEQDQKTSFMALISYGDKLFDNYAKNFENAFDDPTIINTYGCAEGLLMACTADLPYYYIMSPHVVVEILDDAGNKVPDGTLGNVVVSCLTNKAMPLLRYRLGDLGILLPKDAYPENRRFNYPLLQTLVGRETDVIKTPNGNTLIVHSFTGIIEYIDEIKQFKILQQSATKIDVQYLTDHGGPLAEASLQHLIKKLTELTESTMQFEFHKVDAIAPSPSGKPQIIQINWNKNQP